MIIYKIPKLHCPFPSLIHPDRDAIQDHTNQWVLDFELITSLDLLEKYKAQKFGSMIARSYPYGEYIDLAAWCDLNTLLFLVDDDLDEKDLIKDQAAFSQFESDFFDVLERGRKCSAKKDEPILTALYDFWQRMQFRSSDIWKNKFVQGIRDMFAGGLWQFKHVMKNQLPDLEEYIKMRQYLGAANLATESLEVMGQVYLPEDVYNAPKVYKLTEIARNTVCFANDLFSLGKEIAQGVGNVAEFNLVSVIRHKNNFPIEVAIKEVAALHDAEIRQFVQIAEEAPVYDNKTNTQLKKYISCLCHFMKGNIEWSTVDTSRYPHIYGN